MYNLDNNFQTQRVYDLLVEKHIREGLKRKGYEFESNTDIMNFVASRCKRVSSQDYLTTTFLVDDKPFLKSVVEMKGFNPTISFEYM